MSRRRLSYIEQWDRADDRRRRREMEQERLDNERELLKLQRERLALERGDQPRDRRDDPVSSCLTMIVFAVLVAGFMIYSYWNAITTSVLSTFNSLSKKVLSFPNLPIVAVCVVIFIVVLLLYRLARSRRLSQKPFTMHPPEPAGIPPIIKSDTMPDDIHAQLEARRKRLNQ